MGTQTTEVVAWKGILHPNGPLSAIENRRARWSLSTMTSLYAKVWTASCDLAHYHINVFESAAHFKSSDLPIEPLCIVLDLQLSGENGLDLQAELTAQTYSPPIIFLSGRANVSSSVAAMKNGAIDFLENPVDGTLLLATISRAIERDVAGRAEQVRRNELLDRIFRLTPREHEVLTYVIAGCLNKQIAMHLAISEKTVKVHRGRVMEKTRARSVAELTRLCDEIGIKPAKDASTVARTTGNRRTTS